jgi:hypothetical protein
MNECSKGASYANSHHSRKTLSKKMDVLYIMHSTDNMLLLLNDIRMHDISKPPLGVCSALCG